jgi:hypothetical protein
MAASDSEADTLPVGTSWPKAAMAQKSRVTKVAADAKHDMFFS